MTNKDGLTPGQPVDFETLQKVKNQQRKAAKQEKAAPKVKQRRKPSKPAEGFEDANTESEG